MIADVAEESFSREQCFQIYALFAGDADRTAHAMGISPQDVHDVATEGKWDAKLAAIIALKKSASPGDLERAINRAMTFVQAHRMRLFLDRVLRRLSIMDAEELEEYLFQGEETKLGRIPKKLSTRALADLATAMEKCSAMAAQALCDTVQDRSRRDEMDPDGDAAGSLHAQIAAAMAEVAADASPRVLLLDAQLAAARLAAETKLPD